jgi:2-dehydro-3-deoxygluconokinase
VLHVSGISQAISPSSRATVLAAAQMARRHGVRVAFDPNLRLRLWSLAEAQAALAELLPYIDIALPSAPEEAEALIGERDPERIAAYFLEAGVPLVAVKCGADGVLVAQGSDRLKQLVALDDQQDDDDAQGDDGQRGRVDGRRDRQLRAG